MNHRHKHLQIIAQISGRSGIHKEPGLSINICICTYIKAYTNLFIAYQLTEEKTEEIKNLDKSNTAPATG
jgi:hypothetical protein